MGRETTGKVKKLKDPGFLRELEAIERRKLKQRKHPGGELPELRRLRGLTVVGLDVLERPPQSLKQFMEGSMSSAIEFIVEEAVEHAEKIGMSKLEPIFRLAAYITAGIEIVRQEFNKTSHVPYKEEVDKMVNTYKKHVYGAGISVVEVIGGASKLFEKLNKLLPDNEIFGALRSFAESVSKVFDTICHKLKQSLQRRVDFLDGEIKKVEAKESQLIDRVESRGVTVS